ncbi:acyltransferase [Niallia nealsonii]|uniref:Acetyltransferase n=1 Tax=Niallia nealsonii TaxID=115979 RepID=A0A2N0Z2I4_9BACI|nr:DapH/DapD/GlmU-related protein [Niallia nealsonii]PKG23707.1 hypothetical protein CWS01_10210 [Niallia nealsonii]
MSKKRIKNIFYKLIRYLLNLIYLVNRDLFQKLFYRFLKSMGLKIEGPPVFISRDVNFDTADLSKIIIQENVVISINVTILIHDYSITRAMIACGEEVEDELSLVKEVEIGKNCFIGAGTIILPGTVIGDNTIIGAGSVVKGHIGSNVVAAGNPCKVISTIEEYYYKQNEKNSNYLRTGV